MKFDCIARPPAGAPSLYTDTYARRKTNIEGAIQTMSNAATSKPRSQQIAAAVIGNALEWYDFTIFGFMIIVISRLFFPAESEYASMLLATATFGVGFVMRPVGGILIGRYADRCGRKAALQLIMTLMAISIAMIALAPTYAAIGIAAPILIVVARLLQGFATGGEFSSATSFLLEIAPPHRRGLYTSWQMFGQGMALLCGAGLATLVTYGLTQRELDAWGWRIPFLLGLLIGPVGLWIRQYLNETEAFIEACKAPAEKRSLAFLLRNHGREMAIVMGLTVFGTVSFYGLLVYMPTFAHKTLRLSLGDAFLAQSIAIAVMTLLIPLSGRLSDSIGRKPILIGASLLMLVVLYPLVIWLDSAPSFSKLLITQLILCACIGLYFGPISAVVAEQFPVGVRSTGLAIGYNAAVMIFGGFAQFIFTWLIQATGESTAPFLYVLFAAAIGLLSAILVVDHWRDQALPAANP
jgi:MFS family permease